MSCLFIAALSFDSLVYDVFLCFCPELGMVLDCIESLYLPLSLLLFALPYVEVAVIMVK